MKLEINWLKSEWNLPESATKVVEELFVAHEKGSTACMVISVQDWGRAADMTGKESATPLVFVEVDGQTYLQTRWFFEAEREIAQRLLNLNAVSPQNVDTEKLQKYFPDPGSQRDAAELALARNLAVITPGGPGTGKTYTLARILAILLESEGFNPQDIQLAAPTGKAADRMREAVGQSCKNLNADLQAKLQSASATSKTIHSLLGHNPSKNACRFNAGRRLPCKILIIDECSMIDTLLWRALMEALPDECKLILLGDPNQLESVGRGRVFSSIDKAPALQAAHKHLTESHRFSERPAIADFALAIENDNVETVLGLLRANTDPACVNGLFWSDEVNLASIFKSLPAVVREAIESAAFADSAQAALQALAKVRILTAHRDTARGAVEDAVENLFHDRRIINRPVIIDRNDPETGLRNGEVGIVHSPHGKVREVFFENRDQGIPLSKLPEHSPAWAITIHRSQGSEYENVVVLLPRKDDSLLATRELLYTAITRARVNLFVFGSPDVIKKAVQNRSSRTTLLPWHFQSPF